MGRTPTEFHWIVPGRLAGSARPGLLGSLEEDMEAFRELGIRLIVTLTEEPFDPPSSDGLRRIHFPVADMGVPTVESAAWLCRQILAALELEQAVVVHCKAGLGRTGTLLACCLVAQGRSAGEAIRAVRSVCQGYIQSEIQENFVADFAAQHQGEELLFTPAAGRGSS